MTGIVPIILAAGDSSRIGRPKALLPLGAGTFLTAILGILDALELPRARVVVGKHESLIRPLLSGRDVHIIVNTDPARGQFSSLRLALERLDPGCAGCLIWPVDQPLISTDLVRNLIRIFLDSEAPLALPRCRGIAGHPAIFGRTLIRELLDESPDSNPKHIVEKFKSGAAWLATEEIGAIEDVDTPGDYFRLTGETLK